MKKSKRTKEKKEFNISYSSSWNYLKESQIYIYTTFSLFFLSALVGYFFPIFFAEEITKLLEELVFMFEGLSATETIFMLMGNNIQAAITMLLFGIIFGIIPIIGAIFNGYLVGFVASLVIPEFGFITLWRLLPHGIFELPAIFISMGLGLRLGIELLTKNSETGNNFRESLKVFILIVIPLLIIAAIIEGLLIVLVG